MPDGPCCCLVTKWSPTLCDSIDCSLPDSSVRGISQARILERVAISFCRGSSRPRDGTHVSCIAGGFFTTEPPGRGPGHPQTWPLCVVLFHLVLKVGRQVRPLMFYNDSLISGKPCRIICLLGPAFILECTKTQHLLQLHAPQLKSWITGLWDWQRLCLLWKEQDRML